MPGCPKGGSLREHHPKPVPSLQGFQGLLEGGVGRVEGGQVRVPCPSAAAAAGTRGDDMQSRELSCTRCYTTLP